jgi:hypothetical protein
MISTEAGRWSDLGKRPRARVARVSSQIQMKSIQRKCRTKTMIQKSLQMKMISNGGKSENLSQFEINKKRCLQRFQGVGDKSWRFGHRLLWNPGLGLRSSFGTVKGLCENSSRHKKRVVERKPIHSKLDRSHLNIGGSLRERFIHSCFRRHPTTLLLLSAHRVDMYH